MSDEIEPQHLLFDLGDGGTVYVSAARVSDEPGLWRVPGERGHLVLESCCP